MPTPVISSALIVKSGRWLAIDTDNASISVVNGASKMPTITASGGAVVVDQDSISSGYIVWHNDDKVLYGLSRVIGVGETVDVTIPAGAYTDGGGVSNEQTFNSITVRDVDDYYTDSSDTSSGTAQWGGVDNFQTYWAPSNIYADYVFTVPRGQEDPDYWYTSGFPKTETATIPIIEYKPGIPTTIRVAWTGGTDVDDTSITIATGGTLGAVSTQDSWYYADLDTTGNLANIQVSIPALSDSPANGGQGFTSLRMFDIADVGGNPYETANIYSTRFSDLVTDFDVFRFLTGISNDGGAGYAHIASVQTDTGLFRTQNQQHIGGPVPKIISAKLQTDESSWGSIVQNSAQWKVIECTTDLNHNLRTGMISPTNFSFKTGHPPTGSTITVAVIMVYVVDATTFQTIRWTGSELSSTPQVISPGVAVRGSGYVIHPQDIADICDSLTISPWACVPRGWSDADYNSYADDLATCDQVVYVELDNEFWNFAMRQPHYYGIVETAQGLSNWKQGYAYEANRVFDLIRARFTAAGKLANLRCILGGHAANPATVQTVVNYFSDNAHTADGLGIAPYHAFDNRWNAGWTGPRQGTNVFGENTNDWVEANLSAVELIGYCDWANQDFVTSDGDLQAHRDMVDNTAAVFASNQLLCCYEANFERITSNATTAMMQLSFDAITHDDFYEVSLGYWQQLRDLCDVILVFTMGRADDRDEGVAWGVYYDRSTDKHLHMQAPLNMMAAADPPGAPPPPEASVRFRIRIT